MGSPHTYTHNFGISGSDVHGVISSAVEHQDGHGVYDQGNLLNKCRDMIDRGLAPMRIMHSYFDIGKYNSFETVQMRRVKDDTVFDAVYCEGTLFRETFFGQLAREWINEGFARGLSIGVLVDPDSTVQSHAPNGSEQTLWHIDEVCEISLVDQPNNPVAYLTDYAGEEFKEHGTCQRGLDGRMKCTTYMKNMVPDDCVICPDRNAAVEFHSDSFDHISHCYVCAKKWNETVEPLVEAVNL